MSYLISYFPVVYGRILMFFFPSFRVSSVPYLLILEILSICSILCFPPEIPLLFSCFCQFKILSSSVCSPLHSLVFLRLNFQWFFYPGCPGYINRRLLCAIQYPIGAIIISLLPSLLLYFWVLFGIIFALFFSGSFWCAFDDFDILVAQYILSSFLFYLYFSPFSMWSELHLQVRCSLYSPLTTFILLKWYFHFI